MKKIYRLLLLVTIISVFTGCDSWLDVSPKTEVKETDLFSKESGFKTALLGVYIEMVSSNLYGGNLTMSFMDVLAQYYSITSEESTYMPMTIYDYGHADVKPTVSQIWSNMYSIIANLNNLLWNMDQHKELFTADNYNIIKGEALGLRAYLHFDLLRMYAPSYVLGGDALAIPYVNEVTNVPFAQKTVKQVAETCIQDLLEAEALLKETDPIGPAFKSYSENYTNSGQDNAEYDEDGGFLRYRWERMNYYAVTALLARVYLWGNDKEAALKEAKEIIGEAGGESPASYELANSAATTSDPMFNKELIFTLDVQKLKDNSDIYFTESFSSTSNILTMSSKGKATIFNSSGLDNEFRNYWITPYSDGSSFVLKKYTGVNYIPMFKISELYLIAAECAQGKAAYDYLNKLRNHRGLSSIAPTDDLAGYIFQEYRREFIGEGQMFFYYKRKAMETIGAENNIAHQDVNAVYNLPIPTVEIDFGNIKN